MSRFHLTKESTADLLEIWDYIADDNIDAADRLLEEFYKTFTTLADRPAIGHKREDLTSQNVLFWPLADISSSTNQIQLLFKLSQCFTESETLNQS